MPRQPHFSFSHPSGRRSSPLPRRGGPHILSGALLLVMSALSWIMFFLGHLLHSNEQGFSTADLLGGTTVFVFGVPPAFVGVLLVLIGATIRWRRASGSLVWKFSGLFSIGMGLLAWVPYLLVSDQHALTTQGWISGWTALLVGFPLPLLGLFFLVMGLIKASEENAPGSISDGKWNGDGRSWD